MKRSSLVVVLSLLATSALAADAPPLETYNLDNTRITVSGISAGGAFATQVISYT